MKRRKKKHRYEERSSTGVLVSSPGMCPGMHIQEGCGQGWEVKTSCPQVAWMDGPLEEPHILFISMAQGCYHSICKTGNWLDASETVLIPLACGEGEG